MSPDDKQPGVRPAIATACVLCSHNCGIRVAVEDGHLVDIQPDFRNPITRGYICNKAYSLDKYVNHAQRVRHPMRRTASGAFERITWDRAIAEIAARLTELRDKYSSQSIGLVGAGGQGNHMTIPYALSFLHGLGSRMWFNALAQEKTQHSLLDQWMFGASPATWLHADDHVTQYLVVLGSNPRVSHRGHNATEVLKAITGDPGRTLVVVDPRRTETARQADLHVALRPGSDCYFLIAMIATLVRRDLVDTEFVRDHTLGAEQLFGAVEAVDVSAMAERCAIPVSLIERIAEGFATAASAAISCDLGVEQNRFSTLNAYLIRVILTLTGNVGRAGGNLFYEVFNPPDHPLLEPRFSTFARASGMQGIRALSDFEMFSPSLVPEEVLGGHPERLRALIVDGCNPLVSYAATARWRTALRHLDLLVVIDPAMTETAEAADYVLPTPVGYEKWETSMFPKHARTVHAQLRPPVLAGPPEALPEPEIYARLARAMKLFAPCPRTLHGLARAGDRPAGRIAMVIAGMAATLLRSRAGAQNQLVYWMYDSLGAQLPDPALSAIWLICLRNAVLRRRGVLRVLGSTWRWKDPCALADELFHRLLEHPEGTEIAHLDIQSNLADHVRFRDGRIRVAPAAMLVELQRALDTPLPFDREFPLVLSAGLRSPWTANTIQRDPTWRKGKGPHCAIAISATDADQLGLAPGEPAVVRTRHGAVTLPVTIDPRLSGGHVSLPNGFGLTYDGRRDGANINELTSADDRDPFTACPHHKWVPCRIERVPRTGDHS
jgi:anaerobic selenocysteine-containing dehydrogenase